ncbi:MAG: AbrB/MazE/SpoVT family DNA-binding domain-containing protein [Chloroflexi bacterium]|nr:AbrB/MazE/SpoVT family DNA-binding domain-containing protein [Chloroflexota bacterium]
MAAEEITRVSRSGRVTLAAAISREANVEEGGIFAVHLEADRTVLVPTRLMDERQTFFWTKEWQAAEREAARDLAAGRVHGYDNVRGLIAALEQE